MSSIRYAWQFVSKYKLRYIIGLALMFATSSLVLVTPWLSSRIVDEVIQAEDRNFSLLYTLLFFIVLTVLTRATLRYLFQFCFETVSQGVLYDLRTDMYNKIQELDFKFFDHNKTGDIMTKMTSDIDLIRHFPHLLAGTIDNLTVFVIGLGAMFWIDWRLGLLQIAIIPPFALIEKVFAGTVRPTFQNIREQFSKLNTVVQENIAGNRVVKAFTKEDYEMKKFTDANDAYYQANIKSAKVWQKFLPIIIVSGGLFSVVLILMGGWLVMNGEMTMGGLVMANGLLWTVSGPVSQSGWIINDWQRFIASALKVREIMDEKPNITNYRNLEVQGFNGKLEFKNVYFKYTSPPTLKNVSFVAHPGQTIAIVGPTGSGKTSLINLICRFYDATSGNVYIDDIDVRDINVRRLRQKIAIAQQDIFLFSDTIEGNIAYGVPDATLEDVIRVAKIADAHSFIQKMPEGYDTIVGERGVGLSGGQKQRVALARALLKDPSILILDDTTSAVDVETEHEIFKTLRQYYTNRTTFIIAHRISSVKDANLILVLDDGKVIESGTHQELLALKGKYYNVYENQYGSFD